MSQFRLDGALRALVVLSLAACGGPVEVIEPDRVPTAITVTPPDVVLSFLGQAIQLSARVVDQNDVVMPTAIVWSIDDASVATIDELGVIRAESVGTATLTATGLGLTATVPVEVAQVVGSFAVTAGNNQEAIADSTLADTIVVTLADQGGTGIPGETVTFTPDAGSLTVTSATTDANGEVRTVWTLGPTYGNQSVTVAAAGLTATVNAIARAETPTPDLAFVTGISLSSGAPSTLETVDVLAVVQNIGDLATGPTRVSVTANGGEVASQALPALAPNQVDTVEVTVGPLPAGATTLVVTADADGTETELFESNNSETRAFTVVTQTPLGIATPINNLSGAQGSVTLFRIDLPAGPPTTLTVTTSGGTGDADVFVEGGVRPTSTLDYNDCISEDATTAETCQIPYASGTYHVSIEGLTAYSGVTIEATLGDPLVPFDIEVVFIGSGTQSQEAVFTWAANRWMELVVADIRDVDFSSSPIPADLCITGQPAFSGTLDDVIIYVDLIDIDGAGGTLGQAGPCLIRDDLGFRTALPLIGIMQFDEADLTVLENNGDLEEVILHEMGHVLGVGTLWDDLDFLRNPSLPSNQGADTYFDGERAIAAFDAAGGANYLNQKVPVENQAGQGSGDSHWRESVLNAELMTPFIEPGLPMPLSAITVQSLGDLGYGIDPTNADNYSVPFTLGAAAATAPASDALIDLRNDIWTGFLGRVDRDGRIDVIRR